MTNFNFFCNLQNIISFLFSITITVVFKRKYFSSVLPFCFSANFFLHFFVFSSCFLLFSSVHLLSNFYPPRTLSYKVYFSCNQVESVHFLKKTLFPERRVSFNKNCCLFILSEIYLRSKEASTNRQGKYYNYSSVPVSIIVIITK